MSGPESRDSSPRPAETKPQLDSSSIAPPSPTNSDPDTKTSRKREREVSLEPATTPQTSMDNINDASGKADIRTPARKSRRKLSSPVEEEDDVLGSGAGRSRSSSPGVGAMTVSPPQEMKIRVRQISQGVGDLSWKNIHSGGETGDGGDKMEPQPTAVPEDPMEDTSAGVDGEGDESGPTKSTPPVPTEDAMEIKPNESSQTTTSARSSRRDSMSDNGEREKGLKRTFLERGSSAGPQESSEESKASTEPLKRPRDDPDKDVNPRETKRPTPPPEQERVSPVLAAPAPKLGGFMAYASTSSPFAGVKGENLFKKSGTPVSFASAAPMVPNTSAFSAKSASLPISFAPTPSPSSSSSSSTSKRPVFGMSSSPFGASMKAKQDVLGTPSKLARAKSPTRRANPAAVNAFSAYASGGITSFALPGKAGRSETPDDNASIPGSAYSNGAAENGVEDERDERSATFGEILRAGKDEEEDKSDEDAKVVLTEQDVMTGEENEHTVHQVRGKLFMLDEESAWKERGTGTLKLNVRQSDHGGARLIMRKEAVYTLLLNVTLFRGMQCALAQDPRYLRISVLERGHTTHYNLRLATAKAATDLMEAIHAEVPQ
ncbi:unnamed protein product [Mycena citricolor]|uniref:RanBD1 domain-containing protein n=1 Tax=Mycena citricolor TaxID=2018698 RepID=A0AAD2K7I6_9AGAR|nr:unnamed protein product [Mycena citricolor]